MPSRNSIRLIIRQSVVPFVGLLVRPLHLFKNLAMYQTYSERNSPHAMTQSEEDGWSVEILANRSTISRHG